MQIPTKDLWFVPRQNCSKLPNYSLCKKLFPKLLHRCFPLKAQCCTQIWIRVMFQHPLHPQKSHPVLTIVTRAGSPGPMYFNPLSYLFQKTQGLSSTEWADPSFSCYSKRFRWLRIFFKKERAQSWLSPKALGLPCQCPPSSFVPT